MALYCLTLPHTPPKGAGASGGDVFGLGAVKLLKDPSFLVFTLCAFLVTVPTSVFFVATVPMLQERGYPAPLALMTLNQFSEIVFMFTMPLFVVWLGLKRVLAVGMLAWATRYLCFAVASFPLAILGLILHGFCYSFVFVGAYMYVDRRAPAELKASAQSLIAFLMLGVGSFLGCQFGGRMMDFYGPPIGGMPAVEVAQVVEDGTKRESRVEKADAPLPRWEDPAAAQSAWRYLDLSSTVNRLVTGKETPPEPDLGQAVDADRDGTITLAELQAIPDSGLRLGNRIYARGALIKTCHEVAVLKESDTMAGDVRDADIRITRADWLAAQSHDWTRFWMWPAGAALAVCALFLLAFRDKA